MKKYLTILTALALALMAPGRARAVVERSAVVTLVANYDLTATSYTYSFFRGPDNANADPLGDGFSPPARVKTTSGAQTTITNFSSTITDPFNGLVAGDLLIFPNAPTVTNTGPSAVNTYGITARQERVITTATSATSVDVDRAIDLSQDPKGYAFYWKKFVTGTETTDGWFKVSEFIATQFRIVVTDIHATSIGYSIECRYANAANTAGEQVDVGVISSSTLGANAHSYYMRLPYDQCRVGLKVNTDTGVQAVWVSVTGDYEHR